MTLWFFMSYAHVEETSESALVQQFFDDLCAEIDLKATTPAARCGYLDQYNLQAGDPWKQDLADALRTCQTLVCVMTARYFNRPYCGREWGLFESRCQAYRDETRATTAPRLIIPVLWERPLEGRFPEFATDLQFQISLEDMAQDEQRQLEDLKRHGLRYIMKRRETTHRNVYETIREKLAARILHNAQQHRLTPLPPDQLPALDQVTPRFGATVESSPPAAQPASGQANFVVIAGTADEMRATLGERANAYGRRDLRRWQPFFPDNSTRFFFVAQKMANERNLVCEWVKPDNSLIATLRRAQDHNSVAVMVIDPWTARLPQYAALLRDFDQYYFKNCVVIIPWNVKDCPVDERDSLQQAVQSALQARFAGSNACYLRPNVCSYEEFEQEIGDALRDLEEILSGQRLPQRELRRGRFESPPAVAATGR